MSIGAILSKAGRQAVDLFFPPRCAVCGRGIVSLPEMSRIVAAGAVAALPCLLAAGLTTICQKCALASSLRGTRRRMCFRAPPGSSFTG
jgi:hypothetical protein